MAPFIEYLWRRGGDESLTPHNEFYSQLVNPSDVFSVLLILGGDVISRALAQLAGSGVAPVTFSFGTLLYSVFLLVIYLNIH